MDIPITSPAASSPSFEKLKLKLRELFELDKADLDFGIYRVLRQRHGEITKFLDEHLEKTVRDALTSHSALQHGHLEEDLKKAEAAAQAAGIAPEASPKVMELRGKLKKGGDLDATADEVYSHLLTFFSRYYQGGDFLGLQRSTVHGRERYMIPYNGEEVKLIWANMDQYYIKSSELLRDYKFHIRKADLATGELQLDDLPEQSIVQFKLIEGDTEKDNRKPDGKTTRAFALDEEAPFEENENSLSIRFRYREHSSERNLQDKLNIDTEKTLADSLPRRWKTLLLALDPSHQPKTEKERRTVLAKHLRGFTAKFSFDYFIHKDLGGFLRRELDFYVKNEVMHLDDIEDAAAPKADEYLSKIRAIRRCALPVIQMIAQLEDFQKKLWLKKKFVVETRYCLTLDRVPEDLYGDICASEAQWQEWAELVALSELKPQRTSEFLKANPHLMIDTRHFSREFMFKLLAGVEDLDATLSGACFRSENFQALQLMQERYREQVKCIFTDPPYNTGQNDFVYKDAYQHASWLSLLLDRLERSRHLMSKDASLWLTLDDHESANFRLCAESVLGSRNFMGEIAWEKVYSPRMDSVVFSSSFDHIFVFSKNPSWAPKRIKIVPDLEQFPHTDENGRRYRSDPLRKWGKGSLRADRPNLWFSIKSPDGVDVWPIKPDGTEGRWRWEKSTVAARYSELDWLDKGNGLQPYVRQYADKSDDRPVETLWNYDEAGSTHESQEELKTLLLKSGATTPKPTRLVRKVISVLPKAIRSSQTHLQDLVQRVTP